MLRFRLLASRFSFQLMWVWAGIMLLGLGTMHYRQINGEKVKCEGILKYFIFWYNYDSVVYTDTKEDIMPNPEITAKLLNWIHKLGLDQVSA